MRLIAILITALLTASCAGIPSASPGGIPEASGTVSPPSVPDTTLPEGSTTTTVSREPTTTLPPVGTTTVPPAAPAASDPELPDPRPVFEAWVGALSRGDLEAAWEMLAPDSREAVGSFQAFVAMRTDLAEGWAAWAHASDIGYSLDYGEDGHALLVIDGVVEQEGYRGPREVFMPLFYADGEVYLDPFRALRADPQEAPSEGPEEEEEPEHEYRYPLPADSGEGRRIVYSNSQQRVWLVEEDGTVIDTYPVSGRKGVPAPGTYEVYSKSEVAHAGHDGITMAHMVRFAYGRSLPIGFHAIPRDGRGRPLQSPEQLGEYASAGCVRQADDKAELLFRWAEIGTRVVVLS